MNSVTLVRISDEWRQKFHTAYPKDKHFHGVWKKLTGESANSGIDKSTQTDASRMVWVMMRSMTKTTTRENRDAEKGNALDIVVKDPTNEGFEQDSGSEEDVSDAVGNDTRDKDS